jgi:SAM-dependent methyltransferase
MVVELSRCPACASTQSSLLHGHALDYITGKVFQVWRCAECGLGFTLPRPENMARHYPARYRRYTPAVLALLKALYRRRARRWSRGFTGPGRALEVGCGDGLMLATLREAGWRVAGTERTPQAAAFARQRLGLPVFVGDLDALSPEPTFELIILFQVLEHLPDPTVTLRQCARLLNPKGRLVVGLPNLASWQARFGGPVWFHLDVPRHLVHFSPESLDRALRQAGLQIARIGFVSLEHDPYGWIQSILNRLGIRHNHLTRLLMRLDDPGVGGIIQVAAAGLLLIPCLALSVVSWIVGKGALMEIQAIRAVDSSQEENA